MKENIMEHSDQIMAPTYKRFPVLMTRGQGCTLWDDQGKSYTDFVAGIAVCNLGHVHPEVTKALCLQASTLWHVSNLFYTEPQVRLAAWLVKNSFADRVFFGNSGAEANEAAIKLARKYFKLRGQAEKYRIISMEKSFHGRTMATLSATGQAKVREGYDPVLEGFDFVPFNNIEALKEKIGPQTCAVISEPIQGEGGIRTPKEGYLESLRQICNENGILLIFDEIQTGMGRTGKLFAYEHFGIEPDIMTLAKALGNGLPIGAMLTREKIAQAFQPGSHASTFGGTPLVTAAALEVVQTFSRENIIDHCLEVGNYFKNRLLWLKNRHDSVEDVRGMGLLLGMKINREGASIVNACMEKGYLINCVQDNILRFIPPLIIQKDDIDELITCLDGIL
jgi:acetylornithine/N-succinyldiaminopimelate aminotransferase